MRSHHWPLSFLKPLLAVTCLVSPAAAQVCDVPPRMMVTAASGALGVPAIMIVSAVDPNGDPITSLTANTSQLPGGTATFTTSADNTSGTLSWIAPIGFSGTYPVTFTASNGLAAITSAPFTVLDTNGFPIVQCPGFIQEPIGVRVQFPVYAGDPDGEPIQSLTVSPAMNGLTFIMNASKTEALFDWQTSLAGVGVGTYPFTFTVTTSAVRSFTTNIQLIEHNNPPYVTVPASVSGTEGHPITICVEAFDPEREPITGLTATGLPSGATFQPSPSFLAGVFTWTPTTGQAGDYKVTFTVSNGQAQSFDVPIHVRAADRAPVVTAPASQSVAVLERLTFNVDAVDPDGDAIASLLVPNLPQGASFGTNSDNTVGTFNWTPSFGQEGTYAVEFEATSVFEGDFRTASATTTITVPGGTKQARGFTRAGNGVIRLFSGKAVWCGVVEPLEGSFSIGDVVPGSIVLVSYGTGSTSQVPALAQGIEAGDADRNKVEDFEVCFDKSDLRNLFSLVSERSSLNVMIRGDLATGEQFAGLVTIEVVPATGNTVALLPNPPNPGASIQFTTSRPGRVRARVFDIRGRLVRTLDTGGEAVAGAHAVRFDGRGNSGQLLPSGIYLFRVETPDGEFTTKAAILR